VEAGVANSVTDPDVVIFPILLVRNSVNHSPLSVSVVIPAIGPDGDEKLFGFGTVYSLIVPAVVIRPILLMLVPCSRNHSAPSGPVVIDTGKLFGFGSGNSVMACAPALGTVPSKVNVAETSAVTKTAAPS
jgi:hypothetical protein